MGQCAPALIERHEAWSYERLRLVKMPATTAAMPVMAAATAPIMEASPVAASVSLVLTCLMVAAAVVTLGFDSGFAGGVSTGTMTARLAMALLSRLVMTSLAVPIVWPRW